MQQPPLPGPPTGLYPPQLQGLPRMSQPGLRPGLNGSEISIPSSAHRLQLLPEVERLNFAPEMSSHTGTLFFQDDKSRIHFDFTGRVVARPQDGRSYINIDGTLACFLRNNFEVNSCRFWLPTFSAGRVVCFEGRRNSGKPLQGQVMGFSIVVSAVASTRDVVDLVQDTRMGDKVTFTKPEAAKLLPGKPEEPVGQANRYKGVPAIPFQTLEGCDSLHDFKRLRFGRATMNNTKRRPRRQEYFKIRLELQIRVKDDKTQVVYQLALAHKDTNEFIVLRGAPRSGGRRADENPPVSTPLAVPITTAQRPGTRRLAPRPPR
ncbi:hypothetical protein AYL99_11782 [Fonsecaea erecta]|uniref:NDT80 domain-containing protein n=1 Tax=Fonsecaea erecta TaxID=1367422 RepID=A0A178Z2L9_9EURO|nr:hypothetical protein AYL99_11782 [Fonsecaea erecta]OAP54022.1 hypothetical protein AYL99_11782 [Fonsecaea erecta]